MSILCAIQEKMLENVSGQGSLLNPISDAYDMPDCEI